MHEHQRQRWLRIYANLKLQSESLYQIEVNEIYQKSPSVVLPPSATHFGLAFEEPQNDNVLDDMATPLISSILMTAQQQNKNKLWIMCSTHTDHDLWSIDFYM